MIGLTRPRGGALSPIRLYGDIVQQVETEDFNVFSTNVDYDFRRECLRGNS